jgi:hypothetical protein
MNQPEPDFDRAEEWSWKVGEHIHGSDPHDTSTEAAECAKESAGPQMRLVFSFLLRRAMTQDELRDQTGLGDNAAKRCSDLKNRGWVKDSGKRGLSHKGKSAVLWTVTEHGKAAYRQEAPPKGVVVELDLSQVTGERRNQ